MYIYIHIYIYTRSARMFGGGGERAREMRDILRKNLAKVRGSGFRVLPLLCRPGFWLKSPPLESGHFRIEVD